MKEIEEFFVGADEDIYYKLKGDSYRYTLMDNPVLLGRVCETISKYHDEVD